MSIQRNSTLYNTRFILFWQFDDFVCGNVSHNSLEYLHNFYSREENNDWSAAQLLAETVRIRDDDCTVLFGDGWRKIVSVRTELYTVIIYC